MSDVCLQLYEQQGIAEGKEVEEPGEIASDQLFEGCLVKYKACTDIFLGPGKAALFDLLELFLHAFPVSGEIQPAAVVKLEGIDIIKRFDASSFSSVRPSELKTSR